MGWLWGTRCPQHHPSCSGGVSGLQAVLTYPWCFFKKQKIPVSLYCFFAPEEKKKVIFLRLKAYGMRICSLAHANTRTHPGYGIWLNRLFPCDLLWNAFGWWQTLLGLKRQGGIVYHLHQSHTSLLLVPKETGWTFHCWSLCGSVFISSQNLSIHFNLQLMLFWPSSIATSLVLSFGYFTQHRAWTAYLNANVNRWGSFTAVIVPLCCVMSCCGLEVFLYCLCFAVIFSNTDVSGQIDLLCFWGHRVCCMWSSGR